MTLPITEVPIPPIATAAQIGTGVTLPQGRPAVTPDLAALFTMMLNGAAGKINSAMPGIIQTFNSDKQTVTIQVAISQRVGSETQAYPVLVDCPLFILTGGPARITMPIAPGDPCLVLFCDRDIDNWFVGQDFTVPPQTDRIHDLSDGIALVGIRPTGKFLAGYNPTDAEMSIGGSIVVARPDSAELNFDTQKAIVDDDNARLEAGFALVKADKATGKVEISNAVTDLKTALDAICTALTSWVDTGGDTPNGATVTAINAAKTLIDGVLK